MKFSTTPNIHIFPNLVLLLQSWLAFLCLRCTRELTLLLTPIKFIYSQPCHGTSYNKLVLAVMHGPCKNYSADERLRPNPPAMQPLTLHVCFPFSFPGDLKSIIFMQSYVITHSSECLKSTTEHITNPNTMRENIPTWATIAKYITYCNSTEL